MSLLEGNCIEQSLLLRLIHGNASSAENKLATEHIETCSICQKKLNNLAANPSDWSNLPYLLDSRNLPPSSDPANETDNELPPQLTSLLGPPCQPETLGRLGRYEVEEVLGKGGMGVVVKAHDTELNRPVAIKLLAPHWSYLGTARQRFAREGRAAAAIQHPNVVAIHNVEFQGQTPYLVMQYVPGQSLQNRIDEQGVLSARELLRIGIQIAAGLSAAHAQGVVHRDLKPANLLLENGLERILLTDFGLAWAMDELNATRTALIAGTPHFMSPEQVNGTAVDQRSDLFSVGATLYYAATGRLPFRATGTMAVLNQIIHHNPQPAWQLNSEIPVELSDAIDHLLEKQPGNRYASAEKVCDTFSHMLEAIQLPRLTLWQQCQRLVRKRSRTIVGVAMVGALGVAISHLGVNRLPWHTEPSTKESTSPQPNSIEPIDSQFWKIQSALDLGISPPTEFWNSIGELETELSELEAVARQKVTSETP